MDERFFFFLLTIDDPSFYIRFLQLYLYIIPYCEIISTYMIRIEKFCSQI